VTIAAAEAATARGREVKEPKADPMTESYDVLFLLTDGSLVESPTMANQCSAWTSFQEKGAGVPHPEGIPRERRSRKDGTRW